MSEMGMDEVLSYSKFGRVIFIYITYDGSIQIFQSWNRSIHIEQVLQYDGHLVVDSQRGIFVKDCIYKYFSLYTKQKDGKLLNEEASVLSIIINFFNKIGKEVRNHSEIAFHNSQLLVIGPVDWIGDKYNNCLHSLLLEAKWILNNDLRNRLMFLPFIQIFMYSPRNIGRVKLQRDKSYLFLKFGLDEKKDAISLTSVQFKVQKSPKEKAISIRFGFNELSFKPDVVYESEAHLIYLKNDIAEFVFDEVQRTFFSNMPITDEHIQKFTFTKGRKASKLEQFFAMITNKVIDSLEAINNDYKNWVGSRPLISYLPKYLEIGNNKELNACLAGLESENFMDKLNAINANQSSITNLIETKCAESSVENIFIYNQIEQYKREAGYLSIFKDKLHDGLRHELRKEIIYIDSETGPQGKELCENAMLKPYKMIRFANDILPPTILKKNTAIIEDKKSAIRKLANECQQPDLFPSNSFYLQAHIHKDHINYIINKVVVVSFSKNETMEKSTFTVQEKKIPLENFFDSVCDNIWRHLLQNQSETFLQRCSFHKHEEIDGNNYYVRFTEIKRALSRLLQKQKLPMNSYILENLKINNDCHCVLRISNYMLFEIGFRPVIDNIATVISSTLLDKTIFGLYEFYNLIIIRNLTGAPKLIRNNFYRNCFENYFKHKLYSCLNLTYNRGMRVFFKYSELKESRLLGNWVLGANQILGRGKYSQVSSTTYILKFLVDEDLKSIEPGAGVYEDDGKCYKKIEGNHFTFLKEKDYVHQAGVSKAFICRKNAFRYIEIFAFDTAEDQNGLLKGKCLHQYCIQKIDLFGLATAYPIVIKFLPRNRTSAAIFEISYWENSLFDYSNPKYLINIELRHKHFKILERLTLQDRIKQ